MGHRALVLAVLLGLVPATTPASDLPLSVKALPEDGDSLEGIFLGEPLHAVDARLDLRNISPFPEGDKATVYRWRQELEPDRPQLVGEDQRTRDLAIVFEDNAVVEIRSTYRSTARYTRMGPTLIERYGEPTRVRAGPPLELPRPGIRKEPQSGSSDEPGVVDEPVYRAPEAPVERPSYLWVEEWVWEWEDSTLVVLGEHYTEDPKRVEVGLHIFRMSLTSRPPG